MNTWMRGLLQSADRFPLFNGQLCSYCVCTGSFLWDNPRIVGTPYQEEDGQTSYEGPKIGNSYFSNLEKMKYLSFLKGGSAVFTIEFECMDSSLQKNKIQLETAHTNNRRAYRSLTPRQRTCSSMSQGGTGACDRSLNTQHWGPMFPVGHLCYCVITFPPLNTIKIFTCASLLIL